MVDLLLALVLSWMITDSLFDRLQLYFLNKALEKSMIRVVGEISQIYNSFTGEPLNQLNVDRFKDKLHSHFMTKLPGLQILSKSTIGLDTQERALVFCLFIASRDDPTNFFEVEYDGKTIMLRYDYE
jgi:hypothetical protein